MRLLLIIWFTFLATACSSSILSKGRPVLVLPNNFKGEIFVLQDEAAGQDWRNGEIVVAESGIAWVKDVASLAEISPDKLKARYPDGKMLGNSILRTGSEISLWPVAYLTEEPMLFFVVGTFDEKVAHENHNADKWAQIIAELRRKAK